MDLGDLERFQRRRKLLKYIGGLREFPKNLRQQFDKASRKQIKQTLTDIYREEAQPYPGMVALLQDLINTPDIRVGIVSRNVTIEPEQTLAIVLRRHGIDSDQLDFIKCIPLGDGKAPQFRRIREKYGINPLRTYVCGDEYHDYSEANATGLQSIIASYGFEDYQRLVESFNIPPEVIAKTPAEMANRLRHALDLQLMD
jgi:phosphoglycolate phosphatase